MRMAEARDTAQWVHTSVLVAFIFNAAVGDHRKAKSPEYFFRAFTGKRVPKAPVEMAPISVLKDVFLGGRKPASKQETQL